MSFSLLLVWLGLAFLTGGAVFLLAEWIRVRRRLSMIMGLLGASAMLVLPLLLQTNLRPRPIELHISAPRDRTTVEGYRLRVEGTANPPAALVTLVVRSETDERWWVQDVVRPDPLSGRWSIKSYLGTPKEGQNRNFHIVALASAEGPLASFLLGRRLRAGMTLRAIPRWNRSEPLVVWRQR